MQTALKNLMTKVTASSSVTEGGAFLVHGIAAALRRAGTDPAKLENLRIDLAQNANAWGDGLNANLGQDAADAAAEPVAEVAAPLPATARKASAKAAKPAAADIPALAKQNAQASKGRARKAA